MTAQHDLFLGGLSAGLFQTGLGGQVWLIMAAVGVNYYFCYLGSETITVPYGRLARNKWYFQFDHRVITLNFASLCVTLSRQFNLSSNLLLETSGHERKFKF
jgi:hypothetical protein